MIWCATDHRKRGGFSVIWCTTDHRKKGEGFRCGENVGSEVLQMALAHSFCYYRGECGG